MVLPAPGPGAGTYPRNGPPPANCAQSCRCHARPALRRAEPPNRSPPSVPPRRPPKAGAIIPPKSTPHGPLAGSPALGFAAHGSAGAPSASGAGAATDAVYGIRRAAAEKVVVIAGSSFVRRWFGSSCFVQLRYGRQQAADSVQTKNGRRVRSPRFLGQSRLADQPLGARCCADGWDATPVSCAKTIVVPARRQGPDEILLQHLPPSPAVRAKTGGAG
jgi:hypothetical protein